MYIHIFIHIQDTSGLSREDLKAAMELEANMAMEDRLLLETADKRNELEGYLYSMRDKLEGNLKSFIADGDKDKLKNMMNDAEEWLYGDGFDSTKKQYSQVDICHMYVYMYVRIYILKYVYVRNHVINLLIIPISNHINTSLYQ